jgi:hypothetical protein
LRWCDSSLSHAAPDHVWSRLRETPFSAGACSHFMNRERDFTLGRLTARTCHPGISRAETLGSPERRGIPDPGFCPPPPDGLGPASLFRAARGRTIRTAHTLRKCRTITAFRPDRARMAPCSPRSRPSLTAALRAGLDRGCARRRLGLWSGRRNGAAGVEQRNGPWYDDAS